MKDVFIRRLLAYLKNRHGSVIKNARTRDNDYNFRRKFSVKENQTLIDFIIPQDNSSKVLIFFSNLEFRPTSIIIELNISSGSYTFSDLPSSKLEIKNLYAVAESYLEDIRYMANNALDFVMKTE